MKVNFFKSIYLFFLYRKQINRIKNDLLLNFNARIDYIYRIYTVLNVPKELIEEPYDFRTSDINSISQNYLRAYSNQMQDFLVMNGLRELFDIYEVKKVDKYSFLIIFGFSLFNTKKLANKLIYLSITLFVFLIIYLIIYTITA